MRSHRKVLVTTRRESVQKLILDSTVRPPVKAAWATCEMTLEQVAIATFVFSGTFRSFWTGLLETHKQTYSIAHVSKIAHNASGSRTHSAAIAFAAQAKFSARR